RIIGVVAIPAVRGDRADAAGLLGEEAGRDVAVDPDVEGQDITIESDIVTVAAAAEEAAHRLVGVQTVAPGATVLLRHPRGKANISMTDAGAADGCEGECNETENLALHVVAADEADRATISARAKSLQIGGPSANESSSKQKAPAGPGLFFERETRLGLATSTLARLRSTN